MRRLICESVYTLLLLHSLSPENGRREFWKYLPVVGWGEQVEGLVLLPGIHSRPSLA